MEFKHFSGPGFEMQVPTDWFISSSPHFQAMFTSPEGEGGVKANLVVSIEPITKNYGLKEARAALQESKSFVMKGSEVISEVETKLDGLPAFHGLYKVTPEGAAKPIVLRQVVCTSKKMIISLIASRTVGVEPEFDQAIAVMIDKFKFT
jgi:hypothetical protein